MKTEEWQKLVEYLLAHFDVYAPVNVVGRVKVKKVDSFDEIDWSGTIPENTFKSVIFPPNELLAQYRRGEFKEVNPDTRPVALVGMNILDLEALGLFDQVFAKDPYYLERRRKMFILGFSNGIEDDYRRYRIFHHDNEENVLEHRNFDIFIERQKNNNDIIFSGSALGQQWLEKAKIDDFENIEFVGFVPEQGVPKKITELRGRVAESFDHAIWEELNKSCIACGRCTNACPTCFCYDTVDAHHRDGVDRSRQWSSCFMNDFSSIAGGREYLDTVKKKIYFWYYHKFVRIPDQFSYAGCVSCLRCFKVCPAGINIVKVLQRLKDKNKNEKPTSSPEGENHRQDETK